MSQNCSGPTSTAVVEDEARDVDQLASEIDSQNIVYAAAVKFHPLADMFGLMEGEEFDALVADIKKNGQHARIVLKDGMILDGRNRYRACRKLGIEPSFACEAYSDQIIDPAAYVISANIRRRHLTAEQKRELIVRFADRTKSDRAIAADMKTNKDTVGRLRKKAEATVATETVEKRVGKDGKARKRPAKQARKQPSTKVKPAAALAVADCEDSFLDDDGDFAPVDPNADAECRIRGFLYRAQQSTFGAQADDFKGLVCTAEMLEAATDAAKAWTEVCNVIRMPDFRAHFRKVQP
jgi:ParB-like chromosome segregation protein Spo0J